MNKNKVVDCFWFTNLNYQQCMGIIKIYNKIDKRYYYYVGFGDGLNEDKDIETIVDYGTQYTEEQFKVIYENFIKKKYVHF